MHIQNKKFVSFLLPQTSPFLHFSVQTTVRLKLQISFSVRVQSECSSQVCQWLYICICVCVWVCVSVYIYIYIHTHTHHFLKNIIIAHCCAICFFVGKGMFVL
jgi:hypothetical protein